MSSSSSAFLQADAPPAVAFQPLPFEDPQRRMGDRLGCLEGQRLQSAKCPEDAAHPTVCFRSRAGRLFWRCEGESCKQPPSSKFAGQGRLLGADEELAEQEAMKSRKRGGADSPLHGQAPQPKAPRGPTSEGALLSLHHLSQRLADVQEELKAQRALLDRLVAALPK